MLGPQLRGGFEQRLLGHPLRAPVLTSAVVNLLVRLSSPA
jgi:hypothetical protein